MKRFLLFSMLSILFVFSSCVNSNKNPTYETSETTNDIINHQREFDEVIKFKFENHNYIKFSFGHSYYRTSGVVHDPDCPNHNYEI